MLRKKHSANYFLIYIECEVNTDRNVQRRPHPAARRHPLWPTSHHCMQRTGMQIYFRGDNLDQFFRKPFP